MWDPEVGRFSLDLSWLLTGLLLKLDSARMTMEARGRGLIDRGSEGPNESQPEVTAPLLNKCDRALWPSCASWVK